MAASGNEAMQHQLEFDLMTMSNEKRSRKNSLRRRVTASPSVQQTPPPSSSSSPPPTLETPGAAASVSATPQSSSAELRRLASGGAKGDDWGIVAANAPLPNASREALALGGSLAGEASRRGKSRGRTGGGGGKKDGPADGAVAAVPLEGMDVMRDHEWVMERVKTRNKQESRMKKERYGPKKSNVWSPSMEQVGPARDRGTVRDVIMEAESREGGGGECMMILV